MAEALKHDLQIYGTLTRPRVAGSKIILPNTKYPVEALQYPNILTNKEASNANRDPQFSLAF